MLMDIIGRTDELGQLEAFLEEERQAPGALLMTGEPGIGKSSLWSLGLERARSDGFRVLRASPAEAERSLPHAGLGDLFEGVDEKVLSRLPLPRARALRWALLLTERPDGRVDRRALAVAVRGALELMAEDAPVVIAIDDAQWLDRETGETLLFALRRARGRISVLATRRPDLSAGAGFPDGLDDLRELALQPLSLGALHQLLRHRLGRAIARKPLVQIHERSGGNPFFALELAPYLAPEARVDPSQTLKLPQTLDHLLRVRIEALPTETLEAVELLSVVGTAPVELVAKAGLPPSSLQAAGRAGIVEVADGMVRFTHPLLESLVYGDLGARRRDLHARLADVVDDPLARARHLALASAGREDSVAEVVASAAEAAADRGYQSVAAELFAHSARLTADPTSAAWVQRTLRAARASQEAGDWIQARYLVEDLLQADRSRVARAEALLLLAELEPIQRQVELLTLALDETAEPLPLRAAIECRLAWATRFREGRRHARAAVELATTIGDDSLQAQAGALDSIFAWFHGEDALPVDSSRLQSDFADAVGGHQLVHEAALAIANTGARAGARAPARTLFLSEHEKWKDRDEPRAGQALWGLSWVEFWAGEWESAAQHAKDALDTATQYGLERPQDHLPLAVVQVHRGRLKEALHHSQVALSLALQQFGLHPPQHLAVVGLVKAWSGDVSTGTGLLEQAEQRAAELGWLEPSLRWWTGDLAELLLAAGRGSEAETLIERWEQHALRVDRTWVLPHALRCRGLIAASRSDVDLAQDLIESAISDRARVDDPYGYARAQLALGVVRRRARQKRSAREAIELSLEMFQRLDALTWIDTAHAELGRIGGRVRLGGLTVTERRVAVLVAEGGTNREVADTLFLSERTVASHLTHIYEKLDVRSRTQLARKIQTF
jgi:DNA-binding CsgD family transcriptional regulator